MRREPRRLGRRTTGATMTSKDEENDDDDDDDNVETGDEAGRGFIHAPRDMRGEDVDLSYAAGKVSLVTNVASE